jgi:predicted naringenin-chalcone synthase
MDIRRPIAALMTALALFGGGAATLTACGDPAGTDRRDGTAGSLPNNSDPENNSEDQSNDRQDPD